MTAPPSPLVLLLQLLQRARNAPNLTELHFILVNETHTLTPYRQAVLWNDQGEVLALSGVALVDPKVPFVLWLQQLFTHFPPATETAPLLLHGHSTPEAIAHGWQEWLPESAILIPLMSREHRNGLLLLARDPPFDEAEAELLHHLADGYAHAWRCQLQNRTQRRLSRLLPKNKIRSVAILALLVSGLAWPVPLSVLAPAEVTPIRPEVVRAPMDGVLQRFHLQPNDPVVPGQPLFDFDATTLKNRLEVAEKSLAIAESEYLLTSQLALQDPRSKAQLAILAGRVEEKRLEADGVREQLARTHVKAEQAGIALFSDPQGWIGRPVVTGEKILTVALEQETEIEAWLSPGDLIPLPSDARITLFLNIDPLHPRAARLRLLAYEATARPDGTVAHQLRATLLDADLPPRPGLKGIARIEGETVRMAWWILRRPISLVRQWLGW
ncbi:MAG: secretion protein HylD [Magnetococcales bacterium]|nr:secretion protein HylD [Magnetococcales bacterium]